jgi:hypothetical protein
MGYADCRSRPLEMYRASSMPLLLEILAEFVLLELYRIRHFECLNAQYQAVYSCVRICENTARDAVLILYYSITLFAPTPMVYLTIVR